MRRTSWRPCGWCCSRRHRATSWWAPACSTRCGSSSRQPSTSWAWVSSALATLSLPVLRTNPLVGSSKLFALARRWHGSAVEEEGVDKASGRVVVRVNPAFYRVNDVRLSAFCRLNHAVPSFAFASASLFVGVLALEYELISGVWRGAQESERLVGDCGRMKALGWRHRHPFEGLVEEMVRHDLADLQSAYHS